MNQKVFIQKSDEILGNMNTEELRNCLHAIVRKIPENKRDTFLQLLDGCYSQNECKENDKTFQYKRLMQDEKVRDKLTEIREIFKKIENGELHLSAQGYEDYSSGYWASEWIWEYEDNECIGRIIEDAALFAHDCVNDSRYEEALSVFSLVMDAQILVEDEWGGDPFELKVEEMVSGKLVGVNLKALALDVLYSEYQIQPAEKRANRLYFYFAYPYFKDIHIENIFSIGREELRDIDMFLQSWIDFLLQQSGDVAARLLREAILYYKGTEGLVEMARQGYKEHPSIYLAALLEYEKTHHYEKLKEIGKESLEKLEDDLKIRGEIAIKTAQASFCVNDIEYMKECWYEAFYSNSTIPNYLRLFIDREAIRGYKDLAERRIENLYIYNCHCNQHISETAKNNISELDYKYLYFFSGHFDKVKNWCMEHNNPLGWSGKFIGFGVDLMLLYLYANNNLRKAGIKIAGKVLNRMGFNESRNLVFIKENTVFETDVSVQKGEEIFWNIFCLWKVNYAIDADEIKSYVALLATAL